jgi:CheY-like chemotaxis protein
MQLGYIVRQAPNGNEALEILLSHKIDLVVTDKSMPNMLGSELAEHIHAMSSNIPVIVLTGQIQSISCFTNNVTQYVIKPVELAHLREIISHSFRTSRPKNLEFKIPF